MKPTIEVPVELFDAMTDNIGVAAAAALAHDIDLKPYKNAFVACGMQAEKLLEAHKANQDSQLVEMTEKKALDLFEEKFLVVADEMLFCEAERLYNIWRTNYIDKVRQIPLKWAQIDDCQIDVWKSVAKAALSK